MENRDENCFAWWKWRINEFVLTNKGKSIPKLIVINKETGGGLAHWRPKGAADLITNYKKEHGAIDETAKPICNCGNLHEGLSSQEEIIWMMLDLDKEEE
jgi:hypothetical protein